MATGISWCCRASGYRLRASGCVVRLGDEAGACGGVGPGAGFDGPLPWRPLTWLEDTRMKTMLCIAAVAAVSSLACKGTVQGGNGDGGTGDDGGSSCNTQPVIVRQSAIDKIDLLFMIDNSASM